MATMRVLVDRLTTTPAPLRFEGDAAWWGEVASEPLLSEPLVLELSAYKMGEDVYLEGEATGAFELACSRCLARYRHALREAFRIVLEPAADRMPSDPEGAESLVRHGVWLGEELEAGWYRGSEIDLTRYLQEVVALELPVQPLCRDDCRGLCPRCGADRNTENCSCGEARPESPFGVLGKLVTERGD